MKTKNKRNYLEQSGITLIALVVTIVVLLILAGVSLNAIFSENGLINRAKDAQNKMNQAQNSDWDAINGLDNWIYEATGESKPITNPYDPNGWTIAYICNNGTWNDTPLTAANGDTIPENTQIVAKFYATGEKITPPSLKFGEDITISSSEGESYKVVIEGTGEMGSLKSEDEEGNIELYAWQAQGNSWLEWGLGGMQGDEIYWITLYVTELTICDGITNIGNMGFTYGLSLKKVTLPSTIKEVGEGAFGDCISLPSVTIPNGVIDVGEGAFATENEKVTKLIVSNETEAKKINSLNDSAPCAKTVVANENNIVQNTINATEVANHPVVYCGKEVTGYTCDNSAGVNKWAIYHSDGKNIYLIADNYITAEYIPSKDGVTMGGNRDFDYPSCEFYDDLLNKYTGAANITDANITPWLSYLKSSYGGSDNTNNNMKATAYLLDTEIWKGFKNLTKAEYAIGAPTLDMFVASYNTRFSRQIEIMAQETGYKIKFTDEDSYGTALIVYDYLTAYKAYKDNSPDNMWIASPVADDNSKLFCVGGGARGMIEDSLCGGNYHMRTSGMGLCPIVCLEDGVTLEKQEVNGEIVYNIK